MGDLYKAYPSAFEGEHEAQGADKCAVPGADASPSV